jgi:hypothetical protein
VRIISPYKDYYDYVGHQFGPDASKVVYKRDVFENNSVPTEEGYVRIEHNLPDDIGRVIREQAYVREYAALVICGKPTLIERQGPSQAKPYQYYQNKNIEAEEFDWRTSSQSFHFDRSVPYWARKLKLWISEEPRMELIYAAYRKLAIALEVPVFILQPASSSRLATIVQRVPRLADIPGIPAKYPPQQIYQDISYFTENSIHQNPDMMPTPKITNEELIASKGFDTKRSFRPKMK